MAKMITVDPITRIEGHLRIDVEVDRGKVQNSWSSGQMWRGIEKILEGRDPRDAWAFTQRICGVCTTVHAMASVRSVENALGIQVPMNAQLIRNLIIAAHSLHDHIVHFYHLSALDWVDVVSALSGDPKRASKLAESLSPWPGNSVKALTAVKAKVKGFVEAGQLGIFTNGYWGHPAMKLSPDVNLLAVAHYLQALDVQRKALQAVAILGSKTPNIQNLTVGGVMNAINLDNQATLNMTKLYQVKSLLEEVQTFVEQVYVPDVCAIGAMYADWTGYGAGVTNYLSVPEMPLDTAGTTFAMPGGTIMDADLGTIKPITGFNDPYFKDNVAGEHRPRVVRRRLVPPPVGRGHRPQLHGLRHRRSLLLGQGAALPGQAHAGRSAGSGPGGIRPGRRNHRQVGNRRAGYRLQCGRHEARPGNPAFDHRSPRRPRHSRRGHRRARARTTGVSWSTTSPAATRRSSRRSSSRVA